MARPIKATPRLSGKASYELQRSLKENEKKTVSFSFKKIDPTIEKKIISDGPKW